MKLTLDTEYFIGNVYGTLIVGKVKVKLSLILMGLHQIGCIVLFIIVPRIIIVKMMMINLQVP